MILRFKVIIKIRLFLKNKAIANKTKKPVPIMATG
jgi:hypothetical protein